MIKNNCTNTQETNKKSLLSLPSSIVSMIQKDGVPIKRGQNSIVSPIESSYK